MSRSVNMVLAGFGGQGVLFAGKLIAYAGLLEDQMCIRDSCTRPCSLSNHGCVRWFGLVSEATSLMLKLSRAMSSVSHSSSIMTVGVPPPT